MEILEVNYRKPIRYGLTWEEYKEQCNKVKVRSERVMQAAWEGLSWEEFKKRYYS